MELVQVLVAAADAVAGGDEDAAGDCALAVLTQSGEEPRAVLDAVVAVVADALRQSWRRGWQPVDLHEVVRRRLDREHLGVLAHMTAEVMRGYDPATVDPRWQAPDLTWEPGRNALQVWEQADREEALQGRKGKGPGDALRAVTVALELMGVLVALPRLAALMALPGTYRPGSEPAVPVDQKVLGKVRALLAKAESTEFDEEAEALSAKAQELMTRYSLEQLVLEDHVVPATALRLWLDAPAAGAKALLVNAVAQANRCEAVWSADPGFITVLGDDRDLVATELLVTSLLLQATRAMLHPSQQQASRKKSFRQSFLVAYAGRVGERLQHVSSDLVGTELVPVLRALKERVAMTREELFPRTTSTAIRASNGYGYAAGRAAADLAVLDRGRQVRGRT